MGQFLFYYQRPEPATWVYMSSFLIVSIFFMFHRLWSIRNLDLLMILLLTPGLMMVYEGRKFRSQDEVPFQATSQASSTRPTALVSSNSPASNAQMAGANTSTLQSPAPPLTTSPSVDTPLSISQAAVADAVKKAGESIVASSAKEVRPPTKTSQRWTANELQYWGFLALLCVCGLWLLRMILDTTMVRRPLLEPNLSSGGIMFIGISLFCFLMANVIGSPPVLESRTGIKPGPGYDLLKALPDIQTSPDPDAIAKRAILNDVVNAEVAAATATPAISQLSPPPAGLLTDAQISAIAVQASGDVTVQSQHGGTYTSVTIPSPKRVKLSRIFLVVSNLVLVLAIVAIGYWHFDNFRTGVGVATLFLLLPYTAQMTGRIDHLVPGALIVVAIAFYRQPIVSGLMLGCAGGLVFYPFFLFPLWVSFYWQRGAYRFTAGFVSAIVGLIIAMAAISSSVVYGTDFLTRLSQMFGAIQFATSDLGGIWGLGWHPYIRIPVMVVFVLLCISFVAWPAQKSLATLLSCTAAIMTATQFCYAYGGGLYMAWFIPCALLAVYRPNLDDCIALEVVRGFGRRRSTIMKEIGDTAEPYAAAS